GPGKGRRESASSRDDVESALAVARQLASAIAEPDSSGAVPAEDDRRAERGQTVARPESLESRESACEAGQRVADGREDPDPDVSVRIFQQVRDVVGREPVGYRVDALRRRVGQVLQMPDVSVAKDARGRRQPEVALMVLEGAVVHAPLRFAETAG